MLGIGLAVAPGARAEGPCGCGDVKQIESTLDDTRQKLDMWKKIDGEAQDKTFPTAAWAKRRYLELWKETFGTNPVVVGQQQAGKDEVYVSPELKRGNCDGVWKAVEAHELDHARFDKTVPGYKAGWIIVLGQEGAQLARKEVEGHEAWVKHLESELERLKKECAEQQRYQEQQQQPRRVARRAKVNHSAARAAQVAAKGRKIR